MTYEEDIHVAAVEATLLEAVKAILKDYNYETQQKILSWAQKELAALEGIKNER